MKIPIIQNCARCGKNHKNIEVKKFKVPIYKSGEMLFNYWATCPRSKAPIVIKMEDEY